MKGASCRPYDAMMTKLLDRALVPFVALLGACTSSSSGSSSGAPIDGGTLPPVDGGTTPGTDGGGGGTDGGNGNGTACGLSLGKDAGLWVAAGSNLAKVHLDGEIDEVVGTIEVSNGSSTAAFVPQAFIIDGPRVMMLRLGSWYLGTWPPSNGKVTVTRVDVSTGNEATTTLGASAGYPIVYSGTQGGTIIRVDLAEKTFRTAAAGEASIEAPCSLVDFLASPGADATNFSVVGNCTTGAVNRTFKITGQLDGNGQLVSKTDVVGELATTDKVLKVASDAIWFTQKEVIQPGGKRPLQICVNGKLAPLGAVTAAVHLQ